MNEPIVNLALPLSSINSVLNSLAQTGAIVTATMQLIQGQAEAQLRPPPATPPAANDDANVVAFPSKA